MKKSLLLIVFVVSTIGYAVSANAVVVCWPDICVELGDIGIHP